MLTDLRQKGTGKLWKDQRQPGEALWPAAFPLAELDAREKMMGEYAIAGQMQQRPTSREGGLFKMAWFGEEQFLDSHQIPPGTKWVRHWDLAATGKADADYQ
jgi:hypothetical protein